MPTDRSYSRCLTLPSTYLQQQPPISFSLFPCPSDLHCFIRADLLWELGSPWGTGGNVLRIYSVRSHHSGWELESGQNHFAPAMAVVQGGASTRQGHLLHKQAYSDVCKCERSCLTYGGVCRYESNLGPSEAGIFCRQKKGVICVWIFLKRETNASGMYLFSRIHKVFGRSVSQLFDEIRDIHGGSICGVFISSLFPSPFLYLYLNTYSTKTLMCFSSPWTK